MKMETKLVRLTRYGYKWAMSYVNGSADEAFIDMGEPSVRYDFLDFVEKEGYLQESEIGVLREALKNDGALMREIEEGAEKALTESGYFQKSKYLYVLEEED
jgi:hypothetical protein